MTNTPTRRPAPYDAHLEACVVGSIITCYATNTQLRPEYCYDHRHTAILQAWQTLDQPAEQHYVLVRDGSQIIASLRIAGLEQALVEHHPTTGAQLALYAGRIAAEAPVTTRADVARLRLLAAHRRELARIEYRRLELLEVHR